LIKTCGTITSTALAEDDLPENVLSFAQAAVNEVYTDEDKKGFRSVGAIAADRIIKTNHLRENGVMFTGLRTGLRDWDAVTGGLQKTDLIVVAGRPGMGNPPWLQTSRKERVLSTKMRSWRFFL
jgi:replicative DNA helicase